MNPVVNIAAYQFLPLSDLRSLRARLQSLCASAALKGSILISPEGINLFVAGAAASIDLLLAELLVHLIADKGMCPRQQPAGNEQDDGNCQAAEGK